MTNPYNFRDGSKSSKKRSKGWEQQEDRLAKDLDGKVQSGSGSQDGKKGDVDLEYVLIEAKSTKNDSMIIQKQWFEKIDEEAVVARKLPALGITFTNVQPGTEKDWIVLPKWAIQLLLRNYRGDE